ncbi:SGNH/GDSL hydrolase family protein [Subtercola sp. PAMC28395]|uniref:SGNH/GDSL hydrolase family protein n=1 Tax=Subtercola sp. PAMC28395 TaxID=2846775 RepID=UPI001C0E6C7F|nr:SGNH/GDSL hydrolase family protein [Subtercola sp. PAMC28395]QWT24811.1 SGNH/GDSL hydrolase family protein [Subtercola sp. PAMC28395]
MKLLRGLVGLCVVSLVLSGASIAQAAGAVPQGEAPAVGDPASGASDDAAPSPDPNTSFVVPQGLRAETLGDGWATSDDVATTAVGDATGFTVYAADANEGYAWHPVVTLAVPGIETDRWVGNMCLTADHSHAAVVYAPRNATNDARLFSRGAFGAIVDMSTGTVTNLGQGYSLAYFNPGCGNGSSVILAQFEDDGSSKLRVIDTAAAAPEVTVDVATHVTSAIPVGDTIVAGVAGELISIARDGSVETLASTDGVPYDIVATPTGGAAYLDHVGETASAWAVSDVTARSGTKRPLASGTLTDLGISSGGSAGAFITGLSPKVSTKLPAGVKQAQVPVDSRISSAAELAVTETLPFVQPADGADPTVPDSAVSIHAQQFVTGAKLEFVTGPAGADPAVWEKPTVDTEALGSAADPVESERTCAVARNDPGSQALQPKPRQVEWAVNQAVVGKLDVARPANYLNVGAAYTPQGLFPPVALAGGGRVPSQVMLGILAQESNLSQASRYTTPGVTGNPLVGNFYGIDTSSADTDWTVDFSDADCGYGVAQVTDNMRMGQMSVLRQRAIALDFAANVAAGLQILEAKWNQTRAAGLTVNDGDPQYLENWFFAVWAYNTGLHDKGAAGAPWGVGWSNNPINPDFKTNRASFLDGHPADAAHPQDWPYPEKVMGFAANSYDLLESVDGGTAKYVTAFRPAWWTTTGNRTAVKPPLDLFCTAANNCDKTKSVAPTAPGVSGDKSGPCLHTNSAGQYDLQCWFHSAVKWKTDCDSDCGNETLRFDPGWAYQADATSFPPNCSTVATDPSDPFSRGLPSGGGILIVDDVADGTQPAADPLPSGTSPLRAACTPKTSSGSFALDFGSSGSTYPSKVDFHQLGAGFNGHFYFAHTRSHDNGSDGGGSLAVTGTWMLGKPLHQWTRILVHLPDHGAWTQQAQYTIDLGDGTVKTRSIPQRTFHNSWISLGVFDVEGTPRVSLSNITHDGDGYDDVAWDAVAFQPLAAKPADFIVAMGDSYSSGEGASDNHGSKYYRETDHDGATIADYGTDHYNNAYDNDDLRYNRDRNACHRSSEAWVRKATVSTSPQTIGARADAYANSLDFQFLACSGAQTENILPWFSATGKVPVNGFGENGRFGKYREDSQIDRGFLDENTTLVTLTIAGNDTRFSEVIKACVAFADCSLSVLADLKDTIKLPDRETELINGPVADSISTVLDQISLKAPNAQILIQGYPKLFETQSVCLTVAATQRPWLNAMTDLLDTTLIAAKDDFNEAKGSEVVIYGNPVATFTNHELCSELNSPSDPSAINALLNEATPGDHSLFTIPFPGPDGSLVLPSQQAVHPNVRGQGYYADSMNAALSGKYPD